MIRIVCTDFDGTVFDPDKNGDPACRIPPPLVRWLREARAKGTKWVICSGREYPALVIEKLLEHQCVWPDFIVTGEREIHELHGEGTYLGSRSWNDRCRDEHDAFFDRARPLFARIRRSMARSGLARCYGNDLSPLNLMASDDERALAVQDYLDEQCRIEPDLGVARNENFFRLAYRPYNKGIVLSEIARRLETPREEVFTAGDHYNDLTMLAPSVAGMVAAPANAVAAVKEAVRAAGGYVARASCGWGVLEALRHFVAHA